LHFLKIKEPIKRLEWQPYRELIHRDEAVYPRSRSQRNFIYIF